MSAGRSCTVQRDRVVLALPARPPRGARASPTCSLTCSLTSGSLSVAVTRGLALKSGLTKPWPVLLHMATVSHVGGPAALHPLLGLQPGEAAWMTLASLLTLAASMSGVLYYTARTAWEGMEPFVFQQHRAAAQPAQLLHGVDVSGIRFFSRPAVLQAAEFAAEAHSGQVRKTRQPYVTHCIETAVIVEGLLSPTEDDERAEAAVVAALLHDVLDDTDVDYAEVETLFGEQVASMVSKVSQLSTTNQIVRRRLRVESAQPTKEEEAQLRNMILTMADEPLVIAIKLADRLHNMRTVYALSPEKQRAVASETRRVWCSLAERLGMFALKSELEDLCFAVLQPAEYRALRRELDEMWGVPTIPPQAIAAVDACLTEECECTIDETGTVHLTMKGTIGTASSSSSGGGGVGGEAAAVEERRQSHAAASTSASASSARSRADGSAQRGAASAGGSARRSGGAAAPASGAGSDNAEEYAWLTPEQQETRELIEAVLPFDATTFNIAKLRSGVRGRRGLEVLQACAQLLMLEIGTESLASGLEVSVQGRLKSLFSTFKKMARKGVPLSEVYDARALRVIVDDDGGRRQPEAIAACYKLLPAVQRLYRKVAGEEDDYIAQPKPSGYQSLHTAVVGPGGVPMEVQMRTSTMHSDAEYGKAAHWAYKEKPLSSSSPAMPPVAAAASSRAGGAASSTDDGFPPIAVGHPVLHIGAGGRLRDGVVVASEYGGARLLCAVSQQERSVPSARPAPPEQYKRLLAYVEQRGYFQPSQGDTVVSLELFTLCSDGKYHRLDRFGHKLPTVVVPLTPSADEGGAAAAPVEAAALAAAAAAAAAVGEFAAPEHRGGPLAGGVESQMEYMNNRIRLLRSMLEWGRELGASIAAESSGWDGEVELQARDAAAIAAWTEAQLALPAAQGQGGDVMVVVWPGGRILRLPRGTTAGSVIRDLGIIEITPDARAAPSGDGLVLPAADASTPAAPAPSDPQQRQEQQQPAERGSIVPAPVRRQGSPRPPPGLLVNVNNRLVPEETPLFDGDYVVLSRDRVRI